MVTIGSMVAIHGMVIAINSGNMPKAHPKLEQMAFEANKQMVIGGLAGVVGGNTVPSGAFNQDGVGRVSAAQSWAQGGDDNVHGKSGFAKFVRLPLEPQYGYGMDNGKPRLAVELTSDVVVVLP